MVTLGFLKPTWRQVCGPLVGPTRVFFDHSLTARGMVRCAMWAPPGEPSGQAPPSLYENGASWYYSDASLEDVVEITPCRWREAGQQQSHSKIIGLLLHYSNGSRSCLGEFRLDCASTPLRVRDTEKLRLGFNLDIRRPYLAEIRFSSPPAPSDWEPNEQWLEIPWKGTLQWWFARKHCCRVVYGDMASPPGSMFPSAIHMRSSIE